MIDAIPDYIKIKNYGEGLGAWLEQSLRVIGGEAGRDNPGGDIVTVLAGLSDHKISKALQAIHEKPAHYWSLEELAGIAGQSRTAFATHF